MPASETHLNIRWRDETRIGREFALRRFRTCSSRKGYAGDAGGMSEAPLRWATSRGNASRHPEVACRIEDNWTISLRHDTLATKRGNETVT
jgi:hypothetical protein